MKPPGDLRNIPWKAEKGLINVVVEAPRGSAVKLKYDEALKVIVFHRALPIGLVYPYDWGFVPSTLGEDGDPLDAMVIFEASTWPGVVIPTRPLGVVRVVQKERGKIQRNDRIVSVPAGDDRYRGVLDLPKHVREQLAQFFVVLGEQTGKRVKIEGWRGPAPARRAIERAARANLEQSPRQRGH